MSPAHGQLQGTPARPQLDPGRTGSKLEEYEAPTEKVLFDELRVGPWIGTVRPDSVVAIWPRIAAKAAPRSPAVSAKNAPPPVLPAAAISWMVQHASTVDPGVFCALVQMGGGESGPGKPAIVPNSDWQLAKTTGEPMFAVLTA